MKRIVVLVILAAMLLVLFTGCAKAAAKLPTDDTYHQESEEDVCVDHFIDNQHWQSNNPF